MNRLIHKSANIQKRRLRVKAKAQGTKERPRLSVRISNMHVSAQIIDDSVSKTLVTVTTVGSEAARGTMTQKATWIGEQIAKKAKTAKVKHVVFDRGEKLYHGRVKALAEAARQAGLEF